jgi:hypothetical protein
MWDSLGNSVDINLDNLSPYSKGLKSTPANNIPMNALMNQQSQKQPSVSTANYIKFSSPPMSPTSMNSPTKTNNTNKNTSNNLNNLTDDLFKLNF